MIDNRKAFSLIEVMVTAIIAGFVLTGTALYMMYSSNSYNGTVAKTNIQSALTMIESEIKRDIQKGVSVNVSFGGQKLEIKDNSGILETFEFSGNKFLKGTSTTNYIKSIKADYVGKFECPSTQEVRMRINIKAKNNNNSIIKESGNIYFYAKCRNHQIQ